METDSNQICLCPFEGIIPTISKKWAIFIISIIGHYGILRFKDLMFSLASINPKSLTDLLKKLQK
jgi:DNA-binding HxlR family transcriptional regulator